MPYILGNESAGQVVAVGQGVDESTYGFKVGDKVAAYTAGGSFAEYALTNAAKTVKLLDGFSTRDAATVLVQGLTALTFVKEAHEVKKGQFILVHAAAGGLGLLLVQLCVAAHASSFVSRGTVSPQIYRSRETDQIRFRDAQRETVWSDGDWDDVDRRKGRDCSQGGCRPRHPLRPRTGRRQ